MTTFKIRSVIFVWTLLFALCAGATSFKMMELPEKVSSSDFIIVAEIMKRSCLDEFGATVPPGKKCTEPGAKNKSSFSLKVTEVLFKKKGEKSVGKGKVIDFAFTAMSHWSVPSDGYASDIGKKEIFFLRRLKNGEYLPMHEAFFREDVGNKKQILKEIKKYSAELAK